MPRVAIVRGNDPIDMTCRALEMVGAARAIPDGDRVLVKPNFVTDDHPSTGITTDARVIEGVVRFLMEHGHSRIVVGEGSSWGDTHRAFRVAGVDEVARRWKVELLDLNADAYVDVEPKTPLKLRKVRVARTALESSVVSVPKLKVHSGTKVTLSLKNLIGAISPKGSMHPYVSEKLVDLATVLTPRIAVIDGVIGGEVSETSRNPVEMNLVIAGTDPVATDAVGASVMGMEPEGIRHLRLAEEKGLGVCTLSQIEVVGEPMEKVVRRFRRSRRIF